MCVGDPWFGYPSRFMSVVGMCVAVSGSLSMCGAFASRRADSVAACFKIFFFYTVGTVPAVLRRQKTGISLLSPRSGDAIKEDLIAKPIFVKQSIRDHACTRAHTHLVPSLCGVFFPKYTHIILHRAVV